MKNLAVDIIMQFVLVMIIVMTVYLIGGRLDTIEVIIINLIVGVYRAMDAKITLYQFKENIEDIKKDINKVP